MPGLGSLLQYGTSASSVAVNALLVKLVPTLRYTFKVRGSFHLVKK